MYNYRGHHKAAVLSLCIPGRDQLISSCYDKHVRVMDLRTPVSVQHFHQEHSRPVLCVAAGNGVVYSGSEDKTVCVWDLRAQRLLQKLQVGTGSKLYNVPNGMQANYNFNFSLDFLRTKVITCYIILSYVMKIPRM